MLMNDSFAGAAQQTVFDFLNNQFALLGSAAQNRRVFLSATNQVGNDFIDHAVGQVLVDGVTVFTERIRDLILHTKELTKVDDA